MATHHSILAWKIPWTEELSGLQSMGLQRVGHDWARAHMWALTHTHTHTQPFQSQNYWPRMLHSIHPGKQILPSPFPSRTLGAPPQIREAAIFLPDSVAFLLSHVQVWSRSPSTVSLESTWWTDLCFGSNERYHINTLSPGAFTF